MLHIETLLNRIRCSAEDYRAEVSSEEYDTLAAANKLVYNDYRRPLCDGGGMVRDAFVGKKLIVVMGKTLTAMTFEPPVADKPAPAGNATFHAFRESGKWYTTGRGVLTENVFGIFDCAARRAMIVRENGGKYPGLSGPGNDLVFVVIGDEAVAHGYPLMLKPHMGLDT